MIRVQNRNVWLFLSAFEQFYMAHFSKKNVMTFEISKIDFASNKFHNMDLHMKWVSGNLHFLHTFWYESIA